MIYLSNFLLKIIWTILGLTVLIFSFWGYPKYNVWRSEYKGRAELVRAEQNRQIKILEAKASLEAEKLNAQAEIERAKGAAEAIRIENGALTPTYIQYLWVRQQVNLNDKTVIYIPTETNLPILEATRFVNTTKTEPTKNLHFRNPPKINPTAKPTYPN